MAGTRTSIIVALRRFQNLMRKTGEKLRFEGH